MSIRVSVATKLFFSLRILWRSLLIRPLLILSSLLTSLILLRPSLLISLWTIGILLLAFLLPLLRIRILLRPSLLIALLAGLYFWLVRKQKYTRAETVMAGILLTLVVLTVCTIIGVWFRGPEMHLVWP